MNRPLATLTLLSALAATPAVAQDTTLFVGMVDQQAKIGDTVRVPITIKSTQGSVFAYQLELLVDFSSLMTLLPVTSVDTSGTLCAEWEYVYDEVVMPGYVLITGVCDLNFDNEPAPIPAGQPEATLIKVVGYIPCSFQPLGEYEVNLVRNGRADFTTLQGQLLTPVSVHSATITVQPPVLGDIDQSGYADAVDIVSAINCAFRGDCPACGQLLADVNCTGDVDAVDIILQIDHIFRGGSQPSCN